MTHGQIESREVEVSTEAETVAIARKPYVTPELTVHGALERLTAGSGFRGDDV